MVADREYRAPRTILLALNSARGDDRAVDRALLLASKWKAALKVLHVIDDRIHERPDQHNSDEILSEISWELSQNPNANEVETDLHVIVGDPASQILTKSKQTKADAIVMGGSHHGDLERKLFGDTVDRVLRTASVPVLSVRSRAFAEYETIVVPTDFSPPSLHALDTALVFYPGRKLTMLHVSDVKLSAMPENELTALKAELTARLQNMLEEAMIRAADSHQRQKQNAAAALDFGTPVKVVTNYVKDHRPDLVVIGTQGRTSARRAAIGSVAQQLLRVLPCDIHAVGSA